VAVGDICHVCHGDVTLSGDVSRLQYKQENTVGEELLRTLCEKLSDSVKRNTLSNLVVFTDAYKNPHDFAIGRSVCGASYFEFQFDFHYLGNKINVLGL
jgi:hypothetical protein